VTCKAERNAKSVASLAERLLIGGMAQLTAPFADLSVLGMALTIRFWLIPGSGVMKTDAAATRKGAASK
jgi:hypothetical protein